MKDQVAHQGMWIGISGNMPREVLDTVMDNARKIMEQSAETQRSSPWFENAAQDTIEPVKTTFKRGDVVKLASGGPVMTIVDDRERGSLKCAWFNDDTNEGPFEAAFVSDALIKAERRHRS